MASSAVGQIAVFSLGFHSKENLHVVAPPNAKDFCRRGVPASARGDSAAPANQSPRKQAAPARDEFSECAQHDNTRASLHSKTATEARAYHARRRGCADYVNLGHIQTETPRGSLVR